MPFLRFILAYFIHIVSLDDGRSYILRFYSVRKINPNPKSEILEYV